MFSLLVLLSFLAVFSPILAVPTNEDAEGQFSPAFRYDKHETNYRKLPKRSQLPRVPGHLEGSAWLWGEEDGVSFLAKKGCNRVILIVLTARTPQLSHAAEGVSEYERGQDGGYGPAEVSCPAFLPTRTSFDS